MSDASGKVICDAGPLIHLDELDSVHLLNDFAEILVPVQVWNEVAFHRPNVFDNPTVTFLKTEVTISPRARFQALIRSLALDTGEQAALTMMQENPDAIFLTDDAAARLAAISLGYQVHGSIGILIRAIRRQQKNKEEVLDILRSIPDRSTLHIRPALLNEVIARVESHTID
jgi:predicted nucleic acid-binding protein